jgi:hypothetical protein
MLPQVDTRVPSEVEERIQAIYARLFRDHDPGFVSTAFGWAGDCFKGRLMAYQAIDAGYHDFEHTLQGTLCLARLWEGRAAAGASPALPRRMFELSILAVLLHDTGYLKERSDRDGTGAKYTVTHVERGMAFAAEFLAVKGLDPAEITAVQNMIHCTDVTVSLTRIPFQSELERLAGAALATADLLGQMAADDYVQKLPALYQEFAEASAFCGPKQAGELARYRNAQDLKDDTPGFWANFVLPRLNNELGGLHRFLNDPWPEGPNPYLDCIQQNLDRIRRAGR